MGACIRIKEVVAPHVHTCCNGRFSFTFFEDDIDNTTYGIVTEKNCSRSSINLYPFNHPYRYLHEVSASHADVVYPSAVNKKKRILRCRFSKSPNIDRGRLGIIQKIACKNAGLVP